MSYCVASFAGFCICTRRKILISFGWFLFVFLFSFEILVRSLFVNPRQKRDTRLSLILVLTIEGWLLTSHLRGAVLWTSFDDEVHTSTMTSMTKHPCIEMVTSGQWYGSKVETIPTKWKKTAPLILLEGERLKKFPSKKIPFRARRKCW